MNNTYTNKDIPSIVKIKSLEKEVDLLLSEYQDTNNNYISNLTNGFKDKASTDAKILEELNRQITNLLSTITNEIKAVYPKGIQKQQLVHLNNKTIKKLTSKLKDDEIKLEKMIQKTNDLDGKYGSSTINLNSNKYHYMFYFGIFVINVIIIYKVFLSTDTNIAETIILILIVLLFFYHVAWGPINNLFENISMFLENKFRELHL